MAIRSCGRGRSLLSRTGGLLSQVAAILRKFGSNAHVWMPGPGVPVLGPELISNGDFSNGTTGWNISGGSAPYGVSAAGGELSFVGSAAYINVSKLDILTIGKTYQCTFTVKSRSAGSVRFNGGGSVGTFRTAPGTYTEVFTATAHDDFSIQDTNGALVATIDDVSVKELLGYSTLLNGFQAANYLEANASGAPQVVDQPVGYVGDAANVTLGANIVGNSTFDDSSWWGFSGATVSGGKLSLVTAGTYVGVSKTNTLIIGKTYQVEADVVINSGTSGVWVGSTLDGVQRATTGKLTGVFTATAATLEVKRASGSFPLDATVDNVIVREIIGAIPATQSATSNKPFLRRGHVNRIRNSTMQGAVVGTPGTAPTNWGYATGAGISRSIVGKGTIDGLEYIDVRFWGTATATADASIDPEAVNIVSALTGQVWTVSAKLALVAGSWPSRLVELRVSERNSATAHLATSGQDVRSLVTGPELVNVSVTRVLNQATTAYVSPAIRCPLQTGDSCDFTIRIAAPQLETGTVSNSYVPTTTAAASSNTGGYWWEFGNEATPNDMLTLSAVPFQMEDDFAVVAGIKVNPATYGQRVFSVKGSPASIALLVSNTGLITGEFVDNAGVNTYPSVPGDVFGNSAVATLLKTGSSKRLRNNGVASSANTTAMGVSTFTAAGIGSVAGSGGGHVTGSIFATIAIKGTVTDADLKILEKWVGAQAGVQIA